MALPLDLSNMDLYDAVFQFLGVTNLTGDPVKDAVYKLLLPMVVLYMFVATVIGKSRFAGFGVKTIMMFITAFIIIYEGYFAIFANLSIYLLGIIILRHTFGFIFGKGSSDKSEEESGKKARFGWGGSQPGSSGGGLFGAAKSVRFAGENIQRQVDEVGRQIDDLGGKSGSDIKKGLTDLKKLEGLYVACESGREKEIKHPGPASGKYIIGVNQTENEILQKARDVIAECRLSVKEIRDTAPVIGRAIGIR